ncbi:MAG: VIT family protein [Planctomycetes bacterium]|nr:VIT family protein [Planctomycetota bacterium]
MRRTRAHHEHHRTDRVGWLRAAVLGANDGIVSTASLIVGVAAANGQRPGLLIAGVAGLVAGAMSMAAGEYVSVSSQADAEAADLQREKQELKEMPEAEHKELEQIYVKRGLKPGLAKEVADQLMANNALEAHARDELGITKENKARPLQAAAASAATFAVGAALPLITVAITPLDLLIPVVCGVSLVCLVSLGGLAAKAGGASIWKGAARVAFWSALAMGLTAGIGKLIGTAI